MGFHTRFQVDARRFSKPCTSDFHLKRAFARIQIRKIAGGKMGNESSEQVLALLGELSVLKELNKKYEAAPSAAEEGAYQQRQQRQEEITREIKGLAERKKRAESTSISDAAAETPSF